YVAKVRSEKIRFLDDKSIDPRDAGKGIKALEDDRLTRDVPARIRVPQLNVEPRLTDEGMRLCPIEQAKIVGGTIFEIAERRIGVQFKPVEHYGALAVVGRIIIERLQCRALYVRMNSVHRPGKDDGPLDGIDRCGRLQLCIEIRAGIQGDLLAVVIPRPT